MTPDALPTGGGNLPANLAVFPTRVTVYEVGPRDGLQNIEQKVSVGVRVRLVEALAAAGLPVVETGAFVSPQAIPQMTDTERVYAELSRLAGVRYPALVPNEQGLDAALAAGVEEIAIFTAASETFNQKNIHTSIAGSIERFVPVVRRAREAGIRVRGYVSTCFGCPYEGEISPHAVLDVTSRLSDLGVEEVSLGDTIGVAVPTQVDEVMDVVLGPHEVDRIALHFHDTRGTALVNVLQGMRNGVHIFDSSTGGLGGCPYAPGATGNLATEDLVYMLERMGIETGVDLDAVVDASLALEETLGTTLPSRVLRASVAERKRAAPRN